MVLRDCLYCHVEQGKSGGVSIFVQKFGALSATAHCLSEQVYIIKFCLTCCEYFNLGYKEMFSITKGGQPHSQ